jgi:putative DNA primase/helicase
LEGLTQLRKRGRFVQPSSATQAIEELEAMTSPIKAFILEKCETRPETSIPIMTLFNAWREWCHISGYSQTGNVQSFGKNLRAAFPGIEISRGQKAEKRSRYYKGITIMPD